MLKLVLSPTVSNFPPFSCLDISLTVTAPLHLYSSTYATADSSADAGAAEAIDVEVLSARVISDIRETGYDLKTCLCRQLKLLLPRQAIDSVLKFDSLESIGGKTFLQHYSAVDYAYIKTKADENWKELPALKGRKKHAFAPQLSVCMWRGHCH